MQVSLMKRMMINTLETYLKNKFFQKIIHTSPI